MKSDVMHSSLLSLIYHGFFRQKTLSSETIIRGLHFGYRSNFALFSLVSLQTSFAIGIILKNLTSNPVNEENI